MSARAPLDADLSERASLIRSMFAICGLAVLVVSPVILTSPNTRPFVFLLPFLVVFALVELLLYAGMAAQATWLFVGSFGAAFSALIFLAGGLETGVSSTLVIVAIVGSWLLGKRFGLLLTALALSVQTVEFFMGAGDLLVFGDVDPAHHRLVTSLVTVSVTGLVASSAVWHLKRSLSELQEQTDRLQRAREYAARVVQCMGDGVIVADSEGRVVQANRTATQLLGLRSESEMIGSLASDLLAGVFDSSSPELRGKGVLQGGSGEPSPVRWARSAVIDDAGRALQVFVISDDQARITAEQHSLLAARAAEEAYQAKTRFLANMSHELRTPLNAVIGYAEILAEDLGEDPSADDARRIREAAGHLLALVDDVLDSSKADDAGATLTLAPQDLGEIARACVLTVRPLADRRHNTLSVCAEPGAREALGDARLIRQILLNLLSNAVKFTDNGRIDVKIEPCERGVSLSVSDTGVGIAADRLHQVFQPFVQLDAPAGTAGTGLGLTLSRRFAESMGGTLEVRSTRGRGSTFTLTLPAAPFV